MISIFIMVNCAMVINTTCEIVDYTLLIIFCVISDGVINRLTLTGVSLATKDMDMKKMLIWAIIVVGCAGARPAEDSVKAAEPETKEMVAQEDPYASPDHYTMEPGIYTVQVNCDLDAAIKAGKYGVVGDIHLPHINLPACKSEKVDILVWVLDSFNTDPEFQGDMTSPDKILERFDRLGVRPATIWELLALGYTYPILQGQFHIFALGTSLDTAKTPSSITFFPSLGSCCGNEETCDYRVRSLTKAVFAYKCMFPECGSDEECNRRVKQHFEKIAGKKLECGGWSPGNVPTAFAVVQIPKSK